MQKPFDHILNHKYPLFLFYEKGRTYYYRMTVIFIILANIFLAIGVFNWNEYHKYIVQSVYIGLFFGLYILTHRFLKYLRPRYFNPEKWTVRRECSVFLCWIPTTAVSTCLFTAISVPEFELSLSAILELQFYNFILSFVSFPSFGIFIDRKFKTIFAAENTKQPEAKSKPNLTEEQALSILQTLHNVMETQQLYLSKPCSVQLVSGHTDIPVHHISYSINTFTEYNFTDFVNKCRVEHFCRIVLSGEKHNQILESIGIDSGFGGKVIFFAAFRKFKGTTAARYFKELKKHPKPE